MLKNEIIFVTLKRFFIIIKFYLVAFASFHLNEQSVTMEVIEGNW